MDRKGNAAELNRAAEGEEHARSNREGSSPDRAAPRERPILFSAPMVRAILAGTKTQTRRVMKPQPPDSAELVQYCDMAYLAEKFRGKCSWFVPDAGDLWPITPEEAIPCPFGQPGDRLWVRETWAEVGEQRGHPSHYVRYKADEQRALGAYGGQRWRPSIHMPRWASRIKLEITGVRVERLQEISEEDARAEGCERAYVDEYDSYEAQACGYFPPKTYGADFARLWDSLAREGARWSDNPWVWIVEFKRV